jgi:hypothetical protein
VPLVDLDALEALLIAQARGRQSITYAEVLRHFGLQPGPYRVTHLCRDLGAISKRNRARGEPELACLVVRQSDRLPGEGFFHGPWQDGSYEGPATGQRAEGYIRELQEEVFRHWAADQAG